MIIEWAVKGGIWMKVNQREFSVNGVCYTVRSAINKDAKNLSEVRLQIDGETQNLDREKVKRI